MEEKRSRVRLLCDAGSGMLRRTWRQATKAGLVAALVPLGMIGLPGTAHAQTSYVEGTVTPQGGRYLYEFTVYNNGDDDDDAYGGYDGEGLVIVDWELPLIVGDGQTWSDVVDTIMSPTGDFGAAFVEADPQPWYYEVITPAGIIQASSDPHSPGAGSASVYYDNPAGPYGEYDWSWTKEADPVWQDNNDVYGPNPDRWLDPDYLIHWYTPDDPEESPRDPIFPFDSRTGYSFMSDISGGNAPYMASWFFEPPTIGDPPSPQGGGPLPGIPGPTPIVPLPAAFPVALIVMAGMAGVGYIRRRTAR